MFGPSNGQSPVGTAIPKRLKRGLLLLLTSYDYARDLGRDIWEYATEISALQRLGLMKNDFRWLVYKGLIEHAAEITRSGSTTRQFQPQTGLTFTARTCFVLTDEGVVETKALRHASHAVRRRRVAERLGGAPISSYWGAETRLPGERLVPRWNAARHELHLGLDLVKSYRLPSPNQETILLVFEEEGWPARIDDPLPPHPDMIAKQRLHDTIKSLNRNQQQRLIRFAGDGTGLGVCWELIARNGRFSR